MIKICCYLEKKIMSEQNINPENSKMPKSGNLNPTGLDEWNARLDNNLEPEAGGNSLADDNAEEFHKSAGHENQEPEKED
ncbi:hypothetical protein ACVWYN_000161 [Pedobacter sp. UYP24]